MGRWTVEESYRLSIFTLRRKRLLEKETGRWDERASNGLTSLLTEVAINQPMWANTLFITPILTDALGREHRFSTTEVRIASTPCRFGNRRWWFLCPGPRCGRRVGRSAHSRASLRQRRKSASGSALTTSERCAQPRRAIAMPYSSG